MGIDEGQREWQLAGSAAELYQRHLVAAVTARWADDLIERVALRAGERVLDVACGTGVVAREAAVRVGLTGQVAAVDINAGMLAVARSLPAVSGATIAWYEASALELPFADDSFDVVLCQLGLQFFPDPGAGLREQRRVLVDRGRLALSVFSPIERNPAAQALSNALDRHVAPCASRAKRAEHALADPAELEALVAAAGFGQIRIETVTKTTQFRSVAEYVRVQLAATPIALILEGADATARDAIVDALVKDLSATLEPYEDDSGLSFPQEVHTLLAVR
jgi:ubiquinone/menaquinone biosynthesis C-methylase UbiE